MSVKSIPSGAVVLDSGEELYVDPGKMQATRNISMLTEFVTGILESLKRFVFGGPSFFNNKFKANEGGGWILLQEDMPGQLERVDLGSNQAIKIRRDRWVASSPSVDLDTTYEGFTGYFQGTGIAMIKASVKADAQKGKIFFCCDNGTVKKIEVNPEDGPITVDNDSILGYTDGLNASFRVAGDGLKSILFGGEGIVCDFQGKGTIYVASTPQDQSHQTQITNIQFSQNSYGTGEGSRPRIAAPAA